jgi:hypothetical protein
MVVWEQYRQIGNAVPRSPGTGGGVDGGAGDGWVQRRGGKPRSVSHPPDAARRGRRLAYGLTMGATPRGRTTCILESGRKISSLLCNPVSVRPLHTVGRAGRSDPPGLDRRRSMRASNGTAPPSIAGCREPTCGRQAARTLTTSPTRLWSSSPTGNTAARRRFRHEPPATRHVDAAEPLRSLPRISPASARTSRRRDRLPTIPARGRRQCWTVTAAD